MSLKGRLQYSTRQTETFRNCSNLLNTSVKLELGLLDSTKRLPRGGGLFKTEFIWKLHPWEIKIPQLFQTLLLKH